MTPADKALTERLKDGLCTMPGIMTPTARTLDLTATLVMIAAAADRITALSAELAAVTDPIGAGIMRDRAAQEAEDHGEPGMYQAMPGQFRAGYEDAGASIANAIRALPLPTHADRLAAALDLPEVRALVEWLREKTRDVETYDTMYDDARADIYVGEILERLAALTPTAVDDSAGEPT